MSRFTAYSTQFSGFRGRFGGLPSWARIIVGIFAIPGIALAILALLIFIVSILALLLLTVPTYSVLRQLTIPSTNVDANVETSSADSTGVVQPGRSGTKIVESTVIE